MCQKCLKREKNLRPKVKRGRVKVTAHYETRPTDTNMSGATPQGCKFVYSFRPRPLYDKGTERAINAHCYKIRQAKTNAKKYNRKNTPRAKFSGA